MTNPRRALLRVTLALLLFTAVCSAFLGPLQAQSSQAPPNVLVITVDTLRPDALGWVAGQNDTPALDRLAEEGFRFPSAVSPIPLTLPSHISIFSGLIPRRHGVRDNGKILDPSPALLAETLRAQGYQTAAFVSGYPLKGIFGLERGFDHYDDAVSEGEGAWLERRADATTDAVLAWATNHTEKPWLLWVHYYDPHLPYEPPPELARDGRRGTYDGEVAFVDQAVQRLRSELDGHGPTLTVFTADHGESLGEHGEGSHGFFIYDSTVLVPLVIHFPGQVTPGESAAAARLVDITPTILDLLGHSPPSEIDGVSLVPTLSGAEQDIPPAYVETRQPWTSYGWAPLRSVRHDAWKLIAAPKPELYDLGQDPGETENLLTEARSRARDLKNKLDAIETLPAATASESGDPETLKALRALGYVGAGSGNDEPGPGLPDPKDRIALREILTEADDLLRRGNPRAALQKFNEVLAEEKENRFAVSRSGEALLRMGAFDAAIQRLQQGAKLDPERPEIRALLAEALMRANRAADAVPQYMELIRLQPGEAGAWSNLGAALGKSGQGEKAVEAYTKAAELEPDQPDRLTRLAFAHHAAGQTELCVERLMEVDKLVGAENFAHSGALGILLAKLGRKEPARQYLARSRPQEGDYAQARWQLALLEVEAGRPDAARKALFEATVKAPQLKAAAAADPRLRDLLR